MPQLQEHVRTVLERTDISAEEFLEMRSPIRHAISYMIAAYNQKDQVEGWKIFHVCLRHLSDNGVNPSCEENVEPLMVLRCIHNACEHLLRNERRYRQLMHAPLN